MGDDALAARVGALFDHVLVDEYQDTNTLQAEILRRLKPDGRGVTVVGDDAQAIYSVSRRRGAQHPRFSAALLAARDGRDARAELPFDAADPRRRQRGHRARARAPRQEPVLARVAAASPQLATVADELAQVDYVVERVLERREAGVPLRQQAVLFRAAHHSDALEVELARRNIPFVKFGGPQVPRGRARQGRAGLPALGREPARRAGGVPRRAAAARNGAAHRRPAGAPRLEAAGFERAALAELPPAAGSARRLGRRCARWSASCARSAPIGRGSSGGCASGTSRTSSASTTTRACAWAISSSWSSWRPPPLARALPVRPHARSAAGHRRRGGPPHLDEDYPDPVDHPLGQGAGVGRGVRAQRRRRLHPLGPGHRPRRRRSKKSAGCSTSRSRARAIHWRSSTRCASSSASSSATATCTSTRRARASSPTRCSIAFSA